jgi:ornithine carbamoyltransferase
MSDQRHFLDLDRLDGETLRDILGRGVAYKGGTAKQPKPLDGQVLAMIFEKPSTRTRVSFDVAMRQLGGETLMLNERDLQLGRGETVADTARVLSRYVDAIMIRTDDPAKLDELAAHGSVPIINGLTDRSHPCQIMADIMTFEEHRGPIQGKCVAWVGDGNNVAASWIHAAARFGFSLRVGCPESLSPDPAVMTWAESESANVVVTEDPHEAAKDADCIVTDVWVSMGDSEAESRHNLLRPYQVDEKLMAGAASDAVFMHCLPAHRGEEVTAGVIDGPHSVVWDEAENRLHAQKGILAWCLE